MTPPRNPYPALTPAPEPEDSRLFLAHMRQAYDDVRASSVALGAYVAYAHPSARLWLGLGLIRGDG